MCGYFLLLNGQNYKDKYRLQLHFSVPQGWSNEPNGLIYINGYYHMFYQHNPYATVAGMVHWGHARSPDLIHWENLPVALKPYELGEIFSGSAVLDVNNVTELATSACNKPVIAMYTLNNLDADLESQALAYSNDDAMTWTQYQNNPVIPNSGVRDFR